MFGLKSRPENTGQVAQITQAQGGGLGLFTAITAGTAVVPVNNVLAEIILIATVIICSAFWGVRHSKRLDQLLGDDP